MAASWAAAVPLVPAGPPAEDTAEAVVTAVAATEAAATEAVATEAVAMEAVVAMAVAPLKSSK